MDVKALKEITSELSLLYVEDDEDLRTETAKLFGHLFKTVETAENGKIGFDKLSHCNFDLVITDINMPLMDGVTLSRKIRENNQKQTIVVTSAHDESNYLLELINIGIDRFVLKPLDMQKMISSLFSVCLSISNEKLLREYKQEIEASNIRLKDSNDELETLVKILDNKISQLDTVKTLSSQPKTKTSENPINTISYAPLKPVKTLVQEIHAKDGPLYVYKDYINDFESLERLGLEIEELSQLIHPKETFETKDIIKVGETLLQYGILLMPSPVFRHLGESINNLGLCLTKESSFFIEHASDISVLLESFFYVFRKWRAALFHDGTKAPNLYDTSMINDIDAIIILLCREEPDTNDSLGSF